MSSLHRPISFLGRGGTVCEKKLKAVGIETCQDLIFYFPRRFDDFSRVVSIGVLRPEMTVTIHGRIDMIANRRSNRSRMIVTEALVSDDTGSVKVIWFNQPFLTKNLREGDRVSLSGKTNDHFYDLQLVSPVYEKIPLSSRDSDQNQRDSSVFDLGMTSHLHTGRLTPVYSLPAGVSQRQFRTLVRAGLDSCVAEVDECLPQNIVRAEVFPAIQAALESIHFPQSIEDFYSAQRRFKFEELFLLQLSAAHARQVLAVQSVHSIPFDKEATTSFIAGLPFTLTQEQQDALRSILLDMKQTHPMNRLLQGDVGAGKTVVAAVAMLNTVRAGYQCVLMAPTEVLAQQHGKTLASFFQDSTISVALITSSVSLKERKKIMARVQEGGADIIIGTHALIQERTVFHSLALAVVDEQHRFGVGQRNMLGKKNDDGTIPHVLSLTATPIPRSLALTIYGDVDISTIRTLPMGRKKIITKIVPHSYREWTYEFIKKKIAEGQQAFVLCPLIEHSDVCGARSVKEEYARLVSGPFAGLRMAMLHGKMKAVDKERVMAAFRDHEIDMVVTTSVIEVGIDVPNATIMLIEGAERFGLAQLHQLRGRVGRAEHQSYCFLAPSDESKEEVKRLKAVVASNDGFLLAEKDLELRGEGDVFGARQHGYPGLKIASLFDSDLIAKAHRYGRIYGALLDHYPELRERVHSLRKEVHLA